jgi:hypothetical protein
MPAFLIGAAIVHGLARLGVSEVRSFMIALPMLIAFWYYLIGWLLERWTGKRESPADLPGH